MGLISYPLYLWHWPLLSLARLSFLGETPSAVRAAAVAASAVLAYLTYRFVETPARRSWPAGKSVPALSAAMLATAFLGYACMATQGVPKRISPQLRDLATYKYDIISGGRRKECWLEMWDDIDGYKPYCGGQEEGGRPLTLIWGDSHVGRLYPGIKSFGRERIGLAQFARDSCPPIIGFGRVDSAPWAPVSSNCVTSNSHILERIRTIRPNVVILFAVWNLYFPPDPGDPAVEKLAATVEQVKELAPVVIIIGPPPQYKHALPAVLLKQAMRGVSSGLPERTWDHFDPAAKIMDAALKKRIGSINRVIYFSAIDAMCSDEGCLTTVNGSVAGLTTPDYGHMTVPGATYLAGKIAPFTKGFWTIGEARPGQGI